MDKSAYEWIKNNPEKAKNQRKEYKLKKLGISVDSYDKLVVEQNNKCAICGKEGNPKRLCADHNHKTGKIRGLLCSHCNVGLGYLKDNIEYLKSAIEYLSIFQ